MTAPWVPPFFTCGECGGQIGRWPMKNLLRQNILDWRHVSVPDAWQDTPHRAVLGTPAHGVQLHRPPVKATAEPEVLPPPEVPARAALQGELPRPAESLDRTAAANGWTVEALYMRGPRIDAYGKFSRISASVVLRLERQGHRLVAGWTTKTQGDWEFELAYSLVRGAARPLSSSELKGLIKEPPMICEDCGEVPALHVSTPGGIVCYREFLAAQAA